MLKMVVMVSATLLLVALTTVGCGVPKQDYEALVAERDSVQAGLQSTNAELQSLRNNLAPMSALFKKLAFAEQILNFESKRTQALEAGRVGREEEKTQLASQSLVIFKSFDALVTSIGDSDLSKYWGETWPQRAQQDSETNKTVMYSYVGYAKLLGRLSELIKGDANKLIATLPK